MDAHHHSSTEPTLAVVLSGAVARGAFQAGALGQALTSIKAELGLEPSIILGTSAGAINAALWAKAAAESGPDAAPRAVAEAVRDVWVQMSNDDVYADLVSWRPWVTWQTVRRVGLPGIRGFLVGGTGIDSLLDTTPLHEAACRLLPDPLVLSGALRTVGVVATWVPPAGTPGSAAGRSVLFLQERTPSGWDGDEDRALDVERCPIVPAHVLASSAVPAAFPAEAVPGGRSGWYVDGGVRLNTPLLPAIELGATHILLVSASSLRYPTYVPPGASPTAVDAASQVMHAVVADRAVEDLMAVERTNDLLAQVKAAGAGLVRRGRQDRRRSERDYRTVEVMAVAPPPGQLRDEVDRVWQSRYGSWWELLRLEDNAVIGRALRALGDGPGRSELLSYVLFDEEYFAASYDRGVEAASRSMADLPSGVGGRWTWRTRPVTDRVPTPAGAAR